MTRRDGGTYSMQFVVHWRLAQNRVNPPNYSEKQAYFNPYLCEKQDL
jgi:hypothetical protein